MRQTITITRRLILAAVLALAAWPAQASFCGPYAAVEKILAESKYHEHPVANAIAGDVAVIVFASEHGETWTIVSVRSKDHLACVGAVGTDWRAVAAAGDPS